MLPHYEPKIKGNLIRVSTDNPCPICEKPDWCSVREDGLFAICMREGSEKETADGGWIHLLDTQYKHQSSFSPPTFFQAKSKRAEPKILNRVCRDLLSQLSLTKPHEDHLLDRSLSAEDVKVLGYRSMPSTDDFAQRRPILKHLISKYADSLLTVPGFYLTSKGSVWIGGRGGILLPCKNAEGHTVGFQIRCDESEGSGRYRWLSATEKQRKRGGVSSGSPIHVAGREHKSTEVWITEGILKADISALRLQKTVIGIAGVGSWKHDSLRNTLKTLNAEAVVIAFDSDWSTNHAVSEQLKRLAQALISMGYRVMWAKWDSGLGKGIADLLTNGHKTTLEQYSPPLDLKTLKTIGGKKQIQKTLAPNIDTLSTPEIDTIRTDMQNTIKDFAKSADGGALLVQGTQGIAKSTSSIDIADSLWREGVLRPVYAGPRHALIESLTPDTWDHIRPRKPQRQELHERSNPHELSQMMKDCIPHIGEGAGKIQLRELEVLCAEWKQGNTLANKRWSVPQHLCVTDCEIGQVHGIDGCPYYMQYDSRKPIGTVHETLFIPTFCERIFGNDQLRIHGMPRQVCILDEPNVSKFYESVDITPQDLSYAIVDAWDPNLKKLLELVRNASESVAGRMTSGNLSQQLIGRAAMQEIVDFAVGGADEVKNLLKDTKSEAPSKHEKVVVGIDRFLDTTLRAYKVIIGGKTCFVPQSLANPIDTDSMEVVKEYAAAQGFPIISNRDGDEADDIPLNFCTDLLKALSREFVLYQSGKQYNSAIVMTANGKSPIIRLNIRKNLAVPAHVPILLLDAHGDADLLSRLLERKVDAWKTKLGHETKITQIVDGSYGITSLWNSKTNEPKSTLKRLLNRVVLPSAKQNPENTLIVSWKKVADYLRKQQVAGKISKAVAIEHYGNLEGTNDYEDRQKLILLGTPQAAPGDLEQMSHALFQNDEEPISMDRHDEFEKYAYKDCEGKGYEVNVKRYQDPRVELLAKQYREDEIVQAAHRIRPLLNPDREIYLLTNLPIDDLPPTRLTTVDELAASLGAEIQLPPNGKLSREWFNDYVVQYSAEHDNRITIGLLRPLLSNAFSNKAIKDIYSELEERGLSSMLPSDSTLERWLHDLARREGWDRSRVTVVQQDKPNGGGTWIYVYHEGELDEESVREEYRDLLELRDGDKLLIESCPWEKGEAYPLSDRDDVRAVGGFHAGKIGASEAIGVL